MYEPAISILRKELKITLRSIANQQICINNIEKELAKEREYLEELDDRANALEDAINVLENS